MNENLVLVGARTTKERDARGKGLTLWDASKSEWRLLDTLPMTNPSWITAGRDSTYYVLHGDGGEVSTVGISEKRRIVHRQTIDCLGMNPVHAAVTDDERLIIANYATGTVAAFNIDSDGTLQRNGKVIYLAEQYLNRFPSEGNQFSHPHQILILPDRHKILVPDKGLDALFVIDIEGEDLLVIDIVRTKPGSGPRHAAISPDFPDAVYVVGELDATLMHYRLAQNNKLELLGSCSTLPPGQVLDNMSAAGITIAGAHVLVSNRGHDSIAVFSIDHGGYPTRSSVVDAGGAFPRFIALRADSLVIAHERSDTIAVAALDPALGLKVPTIAARTGSPVCVQPVL